MNEKNNNKMVCENCIYFISLQKFGEVQEIACAVWGNIHYQGRGKKPDPREFGCNKFKKES